MQRLSDFNARLARAADLGPDVGPIQVEQAAAHVLESSVIFLGLVNFLQSSGRRDVETHEEGSRKRQRQRSNTQSTSSMESPDGHDSGNEDDMIISNDNNGGSSSSSSNESNVITNSNSSSNHRDGRVEDSDAVAASFLTGPFAPDMATVLQLVVFSMRLTELHHDLYFAIYRYLQQHEHARNLTDATNRTSSFSPNTAAGSLFPIPVSLTIAGVPLAPHPRFQLELVLQAGAHYLERIQDALSGLKALRPDVSGPLRMIPQQRSVSGALLVRLLMMQDQQGRMGAIREVLSKLREEFSIVVQL
ncbi:hypothetical protein C8A05DRAFT_33825 [Staphylotrichum tortipilum]|uniref:Uncharacterized protein n=1 Tax=Staphylotrichum tortipilum TaxID=2831512 RepID=A0AAN6RTK0_9PEZI|nr:hypothetical protein C8A05DRAFT_33825 [Staphylotrichum longicolle]